MMYWRVVRIVCVAVAALLGLLGAILVTTATLDYPGGLRAVLALAVWWIPFVVLVLLALLSPRAATLVLPVALVLAAAVGPVNGLVGLVDVGTWGPVGVAAMLPVTVACGLLGMRRPTVAGWLLLAAAALLVLAGLAGVLIGGGSAGILDGAAGAIVAPAATLGILFLLVGANEPRLADAEPRQAAVPRRAA